MKVNQTLLLGEIQNAGHHKKTHLFYAFDLVNNIIHLLDDGEHFSTSLINLINSRLKKNILDQLGIEDTNVRCFIYQDGTIGEYCFIKEEKVNEHPFLDILSDEKHLIYEPFHERSQL